MMGTVLTVAEGKLSQNLNEREKLVYLPPGMRRISRAIGGDFRIPSLATVEITN
jgi:hypothetical protein